MQGRRSVGKMRKFKRKRKRCRDQKWSQEKELCMEIFEKLEKEASASSGS